MSNNEIWSIAPDRAGKLWLATFGGGLHLFDPETGQCIHYRNDPKDPSSLGSDRTTAVLEDQSGSVWVGTWDAGLDRFDPATGTFTHFVHDPADPTSLSENSVFTVVEDRNGDLWIGTVSGGLNRFDRATESFTRFQGEPGSLPSNSVTSVHLDRAGALWVGTWGGGLARLNPDTGDATHYDLQDGLPSDAIFGILEDEQGRLWLSTSNGLSRFDPRSETFRNYDEHDGLPGAVFESGVSFQSPSGEMFFGATNGLLAFYPDQIHDKLTAPPVVITDLLLANKPVPIGEGSVLPQAIDVTDALVLSYLDRVISFEFAALNYSFPQKNRYRYKLEGFDQEWTEVDSTRRLVTYTNLDPGDYTFHVIGSNDDGIWNKAGTALALTITPPWWETLWFRVAAACLVVGLVAGGFVRQRRLAAAQQRKLEALVVERTRELQDARTQVKTLFDNSPLAITLTAMDGRILGVNPALQRMTGYSEDELLHADVRMLYQSSDQREQALRQMSPEGSLRNYGLQLRRRDGSQYYVNLNVSRLDMAGESVLLGVADDVTEEVETRQALATLHRVSFDLASISDLPTLLEHALPHLEKIIDFQRAAVMLVEDGEESLTIYTYMSPTLPSELVLHNIPISSWPALRAVLAGREPVYIPDMQASATIQAELDGMQPQWWAAALKANRSWLGLPLLAGERTVGLLNILHDEADHFGAGDVELASTFANQLAVVIENIRLNEQSVQAAAADERSRIARELHDSVTQTLFTASVLAEATPRIWNKNQGIARQNMEKLSVLIRGALAEMRSLLFELRSSAPMDQSLDQLLTTLAETTRARSNMTVSISGEGQYDPPRETIMTLYRIVQEALNNVIKHAEATRVDIALLRNSERVELRIRDDGRGFDPQAIPDGHLGISIMRERARKTGGDLRIQSTPDRGTEVSVVWPAPNGRTNHD